MKELIVTLPGSVDVTVNPAATASIPYTSAVAVLIEYEEEGVLTATGFLMLES